MAAERDRKVVVLGVAVRAVAAVVLLGLGFAYGIGSGAAARTSFHSALGINWMRMLSTDPHERLREYEDTVRDYRAVAETAPEEFAPDAKATLVPVCATLAAAASRVGDAASEAEAMQCAVTTCAALEWRSCDRDLLVSQARQLGLGNGGSKERSR